MRKMNTFSRLLTASLCLAVICSTAADAAGHKTRKGAANVDKTSQIVGSQTVKDIDALKTAYQLAHYGEQAKDPYALVQSARMIKSIPTKVSDAKLTKGQSGKSEAGNSQYQPDAILAKAKTMAGTRQDVLALVKGVEGISSRGAVGGPEQSEEFIKAGDTHVWDMDFVGREVAAVGIVGEGTADLDLLILDENGNTICLEEDETEVAGCQWIPRTTGSFAIAVANRGPSASRYLLLNN